jgi:hypothetical protein
VKSKVLPVIGWQEVVHFPEWKHIDMKAKVDTGAKSAAIHAEEYEVIRLPSTPFRPVNEELKIKLKVGSKARPKFVWVKAPIVDYRNVKNSGGKIEERPFIETKIEISGFTFPIVLSVTNREKMRFPVLLGRTFLAGKFLVDSGAVHLLRGQDEEE